MKLNKVNILNKGMSQDASISKEVLEYAFENKNIRIQALDDNTLLSITNVKGPKTLFKDVIQGCILGKCYTGDYLVLFTKDEKNNTDYIYRIDCNSNSVDTPPNILYKGDLNFHVGHTFDTLFFYENKKVQKVYWVESWDDSSKIDNTPRVINIITEGERIGEGFTTYTENVFEFFSEINSIPKFKIKKNYDKISQLPSGVVLYFVSYYNENASQTMIANGSDIFTIDYYNRGAKADEFGMCSFDITLSELDISFDYARIYSAIRATKDGPLLVKIVSDIKIFKENPNAVYHIQDNGINQETLDPSYIYFVGGQPFYAKTLQSKDGTLFFGNIKTDKVVVPKDLRDELGKRINYKYSINVSNSQGTKNVTLYTNDKIQYNVTYEDYYHIMDLAIPTGFKKKHKQLTSITATTLFSKGIMIDEENDILEADAIDIEFTINNPKKPCKCMSAGPTQFSSYYNYRLQTNASSTSYKTFKGGEMYRFGILFQTKKGEWSSVVWIGDKECTTYPIYNDVHKQIMINNAVYTLPSSVKALCVKHGYSNYRIVIADPENQNGRRVQAQGIVCPTLFSPGQRALGTHSISSWIMRPRNFNCSSHHFEPLVSSLSESNGAEVAGYDAINWYTAPYYGLVKYKNMGSGENPYEKSNAPRYLITSILIHNGHKLSIKVTEVKSNYAYNNFINPYTDNYDYICKQQKNSDSGEYENVYIDYSDNKGSNGWIKIYDTLVEKYKDYGLDINLIPSAEAFKGCAKKQFWNEVLTIGTLITEIGTLLGLTAASGGFVYLALVIGGCYGNKDKLNTPYGVAGAVVDTWKTKREDMKPWLLEFHDRGYLRENYEKGEYAFGKGFLPEEFRASEFKQPTMEDAVHFFAIHPLSNRSYLLEEIENESKNFYIDESIVTFHSPEISNCDNKKLKFKIVGTASIDSVYSDAEVLTSTSPYLKDGGFDSNILYNYRKVRQQNSNISGLYSDFMYYDSLLEKLTDNKIVLGNKATTFKMYLWDKQGSINGADNNTIDPVTNNPMTTLPGVLKSKTIYNKLCSFSTQYFTSSNENIYYDLPSKIKVFLDDGNTVYLENDSQYFYTGNYDYLITRNESFIANSSNKSYTTKDIKTKKSVRIKYNSTPHAVFDLYSNNDISYKKLLPRFTKETGYYGTRSYKDINSLEWLKHDYPDFGIVDSCWTTLLNTYYTKKLFKILVLGLNDKGELPKVFTTEFTNLVKDALNDLTDIEKVDIIATLDNKKRVELGLIRVGTTPYHLTSKIKNNIKNKALEGKLELSKDGFIYDIELTFGVKCYFNKYCIKDIKYTNENGKITITDIVIGASKFNDDIYLVDNNTAGYRYKFSQNKGLEFYLDFAINYNQPVIPETSSLKDPGTPYLFIGELYLDLEPKDLYNGFNAATMDNLLWYPVSSTTSIESSVEKMSGDTYYLRWDCLKTYPSSEEDLNKVVDITSCMLESHINLDERTDLNRDSNNIMSRPSNFNLFNDVYNSKNNIFLYNIINKDIVTEEHPNQIVWTLSKNYLGDVDAWTECNMTSVTNCSHEITKLQLFNNKLLSLNINSIELINFNNKNMISSEDGEFIELVNNTKVDGTTKLYNVYGTNNMSTLITEKGMYFIDDNEKSLILLSSDGGISKISANKMDSWFKNNIYWGTYLLANRGKDNPFYLEYDPVHKDIYVMNDSCCLIYNEILESFTSFMDYPNCSTLFPIMALLFAIAGNDSLDKHSIYQMFEGDYNTTFNNVPVGYSINYRVNPSPYEDKVFTNIEFIADMQSVSGISSEIPFDYITVYNEYLDTGRISLEFLQKTPSILKLKFRIWRLNIPRDGNKLGGDRIRNPWINLLLEKEPNSTNTSKFELHSMNILYMM